MRSIKIFLIATILSTLTLFNFVAALRGYQSSMQEAETLFDNQLLDLTRVIGKLNLDSLDADFRLGNNITFQIWQDGVLLAASAQAPEYAMHGFSPGFDYANFAGYRWRTFSRLEPTNNQWVIVGERTDLRFVLAENVVLESIYPILMGLPLIGLLIWVVVSQGLKPLKDLSEELKNKQATDLSPINYENTKNELEQMIQSTNGFIQRLSNTLEREKRFSADAAHELRTPISSLKIQLHNLSDEIDSNNDAFKQVKNGVERMQHLIEQLLALYRTSPDQFANAAKQVDLYAITQNVVAQCYANFENKNQILELRGENIFIQGDQFALETLITNLLSNANKYTQCGGEIIVCIEIADVHVNLVVKDNGPGIAEQACSRIFDRFYRAANTNDATPGCGLGLTIVSHVADLHQAEVSLRNSSKGTGCAFTVCFKRNIHDE